MRSVDALALAVVILAGCLAAPGAAPSDDAVGSTTLVTSAGASATITATSTSSSASLTSTGPASATTTSTSSAPAGNGTTSPSNSTGGNQTQGNNTPSQPFEPEEPSGTCGGLGSLEPVAPNALLVGGLATGWPLLELDVAVIADPAFVARHPIDWQALLVDLVADASLRFEAQFGIRLNLTVLDRLPDGTLAPGSGDGQQRAVARGFMHANYPDAGVDAVAVILGADYETTTAGQVECVHGAANPDYAYLWAEYRGGRIPSPLTGGMGLFEDLPLKIYMHEMAHLLAAHHHYSTCGRSVRTSDLLAVCDVMINDIGLASFEFGPTNRLVVRSFVEEIGIGRPVP